MFFIYGYTRHLKAMCRCLFLQSVLPSSCVGFVSWFVMFICFQCLFAHSLRKFSMRDWSIEQKWMSVLLPLLLLYNSELYHSTLLSSSLLDNYTNLGNCLQDSNAKRCWMCSELLQYVTFWVYGGESRGGFTRFKELLGIFQLWYFLPSLNVSHLGINYPHIKLCAAVLSQNQN